MPTFVEHKESNDEDEDAPEHIEIDILANAKRMGLSFQELNLLSLQEFIWFARSYTGKTENKEATQDDIDRFYSTM